jgi:hypothetical protein
MKGIIKVAVIVFLTVPLYAEEYRGEIEVGVPIMPSYFSLLMEAVTLSEGPIDNLLTMDFPLAYRYRVSPNLSAGLGVDMKLVYGESEGGWDEEGSFSFLGVAFLSGPSLRLKIQDGSSPFIDLRTGFGFVYDEVEFDGESESDTNFAFGISPVAGYIFNIKNIDIGIGLSYSFFYIKPDEEGITTHHLEVMLSFTFLHK